MKKNRNLKRIISYFCAVAVFLTSFPALSFPVEAASGAPAKIVADNHCLMLRADGRLMVWGDNSFGQLGLGDGSASVLREPTESKFFADKGLKVADICVVEDASYVLCTNGELYVCGKGANGRLGLGGTSNKNTWTLIPNSKNMYIDRLYSGKEFIVAVTGNNELYAWGRNNSGQVGDGTRTDATAPTKILANADVKHLELGDDFAMLVQQSGATLVWGNNTCGRYGFDSMVTNTTKATGGYTYTNADCYGWPKKIVFAPANNRIQQLSPFKIQTGATTFNLAYANYFNDPASTRTTMTGVNVDIIKKSVACSAGHSHKLTRTTTITLNNGFEYFDTSKISDIQIGGKHGIVRVNNTYYCWGENTLYQQSTDGNSEGFMVPFTKMNSYISSMTEGFSSLAVAGDTNYIISRAGNAYVWGSNAQGNPSP